LDQGLPETEIDSCQTVTYAVNEILLGDLLLDMSGIKTEIKGKV